MNIAGRVVTRSDIIAVAIGSALAVTLAVVPGMVPGSGAVRTALAVVPGAPAAPAPPRLLSFDSPLGRVVLCYNSDTPKEGPGGVGSCYRHNPDPTCLVEDGTFPDSGGGGSHPGDGSRMPIVSGDGRVGCGGTSSNDHPVGTVSTASPSPSPTPPPRCDLPVAESSTDPAATAEGWAALYLSGPTVDCPLPGWRHALDAAAGGSQLSVNRGVTAPTVPTRVVGSATTAACTGLLCGSSAEKADLLTIPITPDPTVSGSDQVNGHLRLNLEQTAAGLWQIVLMMFTPPAG